MLFLRRALAEAEKLSFEKVAAWARENGRAAVALDYLNNLTKRAVDAETRLAEAEKARDEAVAQRLGARIDRRAAEERAAQAERERDEALEDSRMMQDRLTRLVAGGGAQGEEK